jgi:Terminase large subunit, T4likevirus-type, N-terminal
LAAEIGRDGRDKSTDGNVVSAAARALELRLSYTPFPKQRAFHRSPAKYRLFGGAAGPGKTKALLMEAILQAHEFAGVNTLLLRRTFPELEGSLLQYFRRDVPRDLYRSYSESKHQVEWLNGSVTRFGYCANENDVYQYQGGEYLFIGVDELTHFTLRQWQFLTSRNRCAAPRSFPNMAGATNPGNIGHTWVKALWVERQAAPGMERADEYNAADYDFIPARFSDNPIFAEDESYKATLNALPGHLKRAFLDGDWDVIAGQYFDRFDLRRHVGRAEEIEWKPWWPRWISIDWGFEHPAATYWHAQAPAAVRSADEAGGGTIVRQAEPLRATHEEIGAWRDDSASPVVPGGGNICERSREFANAQIEKSVRAATRVVTYREYVTHRTAPRDLARQIIARSVDSRASRENPAEKIEAIYLSPDAFARRTDEASIAEQMGDVFAAAGLPRPIPADDDRIGGWMLMYQMLEAGEWLITENCIELIRVLPTLIRDPARIEDAEKMDGDDAADAARYGLKSRYAARRSGSMRAPMEQRLAEQVTSADPTIRAMQARKAQIAESKRSFPVSFLRRRRP